jgi:hypothetical protein
MKIKGWLAAMASAVTLAWFVVPAQAGSANVAGALQAGNGPNAEVQQVHWRGRGYYYRPYRHYYYGPRYRHRHYYYHGPRHYRRHWGHHRHWRHHRHW